MDFSNTYTELKKKNLKMELLIKEIDHLKAHNIKIASEVNELREQKKVGGFVSSQKSLGNHNSKRRLQITHMIDIKVREHQTEITTPIYDQHFSNNSLEEESSSGDIEYFKDNEFLQQK